MADMPLFGTQTPTVALAGFARFWKAWPRHFRKTAKGKCREKWAKDGLEPQSDHVIAVVEAMKRTPDWTSTAMSGPPAPLVWLNQGRYECDLADLAVSNAGGTGSEATDNINSLTGAWAVCIESGKCVPVVQGRCEIPREEAVGLAKGICVTKSKSDGGTWVVVPKAGNPLCMNPTTARAMADPVYAAKRAKVDAYVKERIAKGLPLKLPAMSGITDSLRNTLADDKRERTRVRSQADEFLEGGER